MFSHSKMCFYVFIFTDREERLLAAAVSSTTELQLCILFIFFLVSIVAAYVLRDVWVLMDLCSCVRCCVLFLCDWDFCRCGFDVSVFVGVKVCVIWQWSSLSHYPSLQLRLLWNIFICIYYNKIRKRRKQNLTGVTKYNLNKEHHTKYYIMWWKNITHITRRKMLLW